MVAILSQPQCVNSQRAWKSHFIRWPFQNIVGYKCMKKWWLSHFDLTMWVLHLLMAYHRDVLALQRRHNECDGVSNHRRLDGLLNRLFRRISKKTSKPRVTGLCEGNSPMTGEFPAQRASNAENVSIDDVIMVHLYRHGDDEVGHPWIFTGLPLL